MDGEVKMGRSSNTAAAGLGKCTAKLQVMIPDDLYVDLEILQRKKGNIGIPNLVRELLFYALRGHAAFFNTENLTLDDAVTAFAVINGKGSNTGAFREQILNEWIFGLLHGSDVGSQPSSFQGDQSNDFVSVDFMRSQRGQ